MVNIAFARFNHFEVDFDDFDDFEVDFDDFNHFTTNNKNDPFKTIENELLASILENRFQSF